MDQIFEITEYKFVQLNLYIYKTGENEILQVDFYIKVNDTKFGLVGFTGYGISFWKSTSFTNLISDSSS